MKEWRLVWMAAPRHYPYVSTETLPICLYDVWYEYHEWRSDVWHECTKRHTDIWVMSRCRSCNSRRSIATFATNFSPFHCHLSLCPPCHTPFLSPDTIPLFSLPLSLQSCFSLYLTLEREVGRISHQSAYTIYDDYRADVSRNLSRLQALSHFRERRSMTAMIEGDRLW